MLNDTTSTLSLLHTRRSGKPRDMTTPGPDEAQLRAIMEAAIRVPDHGKLSPWRFFTVTGTALGKLADALAAIFARENPGCASNAVDAAREFALQAPVLVVAASVPVVPSKIALWEQELSAGAACMNLLTAVHASGFVGGWLTGWAAYSPGVQALFALPETARIAGFIFIGSPSRPLDERPRPVFDSVIARWG